MRGSGSDDINLSTATIEWIGPNKAKTLVAGNLSATNAQANGMAAGDSNYFNVSDIKDEDNSVPVLNSQDDRFTISMNASAISANTLQEGQTVDLKLTTQYGAVTLYRANIPQSLSQESAVTV